MLQDAGQLLCAGKKPLTASLMGKGIGDHRHDGSLRILERVKASDVGDQLPTTERGIIDKFGGDAIMAEFGV
jgi:hypothetical protein